MYGCESWTIKKAEHQRIDAFELFCWRRLLRIPWTARRSDQSILKESVLNIHWKDWCWGWSSNTVPTRWEELTHWKRPWCWERLKTGEEGDNRGWDGWMASPTRWTWVWASSGSWQWTGKPGVLQSMGSQSRTQLRDWTELYHKEGWAPKNWCFWIMVLEKTWESLGLPGPVNPKGISPEYSLEGLMLRLKLQYSGYLMWRVNSLEKTLMLGKTEGKKKRGWQTMVGWHHRLNGYEFEQTLGDNEGQGSLACRSPWNCRVPHNLATEQ